MKAVCPVCTSAYPVPDDKVTAKGLPVRCLKCGAVFRTYPGRNEAVVEKPPTNPEFLTPKPAAPEPSKPVPAKPMEAGKSKTKETPAESRPAPAQPPVPDQTAAAAAARESRAKKKVVRSTRLDEPASGVKQEDDRPESPAWAQPPDYPEIKPKAARVGKNFTAAEPPAKKKAQPPREEPQARPSFTDLEDEELPEAQAIPLDEEEPIKVRKPAREKPTRVAVAQYDPEKSAGKRRAFREMEEEDLDGLDKSLKKLLAKPKKTKADRDGADHEHDEEVFKKATKFGGDMRRYLKPALIISGCVLVVMIIIAIYSLVHESEKALNNAKKQGEASQIAQEEAKRQMDYLDKYQKGLRAIESGGALDYTNALNELDQALAARPDYVPAQAAKAEISALLAIEYEQTDKMDAACPLAEQAIGKMPKAPNVLRAQATCRLAQGQIEEADKIAHEALVAVEGDQAEDALTNYLLARVFLAKKDKEKAIYTLNTAISQNRLFFRALHLLADLYASDKKWQDAFDAESKALNLFPENNAAKQRLELYNLRLSGELKQAEQVPGMKAELGADIDKQTQGKELVKQIDAAIRRGSTNEALGLINDLLKLGTQNGAAHSRKCEIMLKRGNYQAAVEACTIARNYSPDAYYYLGAAYEALGNEAMKKTNYQAYLNARPKGSHAAEVRSILGQPPE